MIVREYDLGYQVQEKCVEIFIVCLDFVYTLVCVLLFGSYICICLLHQT